MGLPGFVTQYHQGGALIMKFNQTGKIGLNELPYLHVVGIDMAKENHVAQATNFRGIILSMRHLTFTKPCHIYPCE